MRIIDLSHLITANMPVFPGTEPPRLQPATSYAQHGFVETLLTMYSHTGTHLDSPSHMIEGGKCLDDFPAEQFFGLALIVDFPTCAGARIERAQLELIANKIARAEFLLFHTRQDQKWGTPDYFHDYPLLTPEAACYLLEFPLKGIGMDCISVDALDSDQVHRILLAQNDRVLIENLCNLADVAGEYCMLSVLPLKYAQADGSPVRAVAIEMATQLPPLEAQQA